MSDFLPEIYLAVDNCFASKRWVEPAEWMRIAKEAGIYYIEANADNECDPLYMDSGYLDNWMVKIGDATRETGVSVANFYSGHGTYATLGLAHYDPRIRERIQHQWLEKMMIMAGRIQAGMGFYCHAFSQSCLQHPELYHAACDDLYERLSALAQFAAEHNIGPIGLEQMYTPHQIPWTINGAKNLLREVFRRSNCDFYLTIDTGHQCAQRQFIRPDEDAIRNAMRNFDRTGQIDEIWMGTESARFHLEKIAVTADRNLHISALLAELDAYPYLFASNIDGDPYAWLKQLACFSPIIHLQQTNGFTSAHLPFDPHHNADGIITAEKVLSAIVDSYRRSWHGMPKPCQRIYLTLEIFSGTAETPDRIIRKIKDSAAYWRHFIPHDGESLGKIMERFSSRKIV